MKTKKKPFKTVHLSNKTPYDDLKNNALNHYEEASKSIHCWNSDIPKAIKFYYDFKKNEEKTKESFLTYI